MMRFPGLRLDHGKRLFFGYAQGVGCCAMLQMWELLATVVTSLLWLCEAMGTTLINEKGEIHLYDKSNL